MIRVLQYGLSGNRGGIEAVCMKVFRNLDRNKIMFDFLTEADPIAFEDEIQALGGRIFKMPRRREHPLKHYIAYYRFFKENGKDYAAIHCSYCALYSILPLSLAKTFGIPQVILHARSAGHYSPRTLNHWMHGLNSVVVDKIADRLLACSDEAAKFMFSKRRYAAKTFEIWRNPVDTQSFRRDDAIASRMRMALGLQDAFVVGHVGVFLPVKNHRFILDVFRELNARATNSRLLLVGGGTEEAIGEITEYAASLGIGQAVTLAGMVDNVGDYMQVMDAFLFPSLYEGLPNVVVEAQAAGLPCFLSDHITTEVAVTPGMVEFIALDKPAAFWAERILCAKGRVNDGNTVGVGADGLKQFALDSCVRQYEHAYLSDGDGQFIS